MGPVLASDLVVRQHTPPQTSSLLFHPAVVDVPAQILQQFNDISTAQIIPVVASAQGPSPSQAGTSSDRLVEQVAATPVNSVIDMCSPSPSPCVSHIDNPHGNNPMPGLKNKGKVRPHLYITLFGVDVRILSDPRIPCCVEDN